MTAELTSDGKYQAVLEINEDRQRKGNATFDLGAKKLVYVATADTPQVARLKVEGNKHFASPTFEQCSAVFLVFKLVTFALESLV